MMMVMVTGMNRLSLVDPVGTVGPVGPVGPVAGPVGPVAGPVGPAALSGRFPAPDFLEGIYVKNMEAAITNIERKERQSEMQRKRNAEQASLTTAPASSSGQPDAASSSVPEPKAAPVLEPKTPPQGPPQRSGQPAAARHQSWSWNRDHYGSRREWTRWQGAWHYRDDRRSRWIYWGR